MRLNGAPLDVLEIELQRRVRARSGKTDLMLRYFSMRGRSDCSLISSQVQFACVIPVHVGMDHIPRTREKLGLYTNYSLLPVQTSLCTISWKLSKFLAVLWNFPLPSAWERILKWPPRFPCFGVHTQHNSLSLRVGGPDISRWALLEEPLKSERGVWEIWSSRRFSSVGFE